METSINNKAQASIIFLPHKITSEVNSFDDQTQSD